MNLKGILAISGYSGLFKLVSQTKNGIIVESLEDKKRMPAYATSHHSTSYQITSHHITPHLITSHHMSCLA